MDLISAWSVCLGIWGTVTCFNLSQNNSYKLHLNINAFFFDIISMVVLISLLFPLFYDVNSIQHRFHIKVWSSS